VFGNGVADSGVAGSVIAAAPASRKAVRRESRPFPGESIGAIAEQNPRDR